MQGAELEDYIKRNEVMPEWMAGRSPKTWQSEFSTHYANPFGKPAAEVDQLFQQYLHGTKREHQTAQRELITRAQKGDVNGLFDVLNATLLKILFIQSDDPVVMKIKGQDSRRSSDFLAELKGSKELIAELGKRLTAEAAYYPADPARISTPPKVQLAAACFRGIKLGDQNTPAYYSDFERMALGIGPVIEGSRAGITFPPRLTPRETLLVEAIAESGDGAAKNIINLEPIIKAMLGMHRKNIELAEKALLPYFRTENLGQIANSLGLMSACLDSRDKAVRNSTASLFTKVRHPSEFVAIDHQKLEWYGVIQQTVTSEMDDKTESSDPSAQTLIEQFGQVIRRLSDMGRLQEFARLFFTDPASTLSAQDGLMNTSGINLKLRDTLTSSSKLTPELEMLVKAFRRDGHQISEPAVADLFDEKRPLGHFIDHLKAKYPALDDIVLNEIWPSFIGAQKADSWPSERELDILEFTSKHPAAVIGLDDIRFYTIGYTAPEVGVSFSFKKIRDPLIGELNTSGQLVGLPYDLAKDHPHIYTFFAFTAVDSFRKLVTRSSRRIELKDVTPPTNQPEQRDENEENDTTTHNGISLPRNEVSRITLQPVHRPRRVRSDEVDLGEKQPKSISQKVVPLPYAQRLRYLADRLKNAADYGLNPDEIRELEGLFALTSASLASPSPQKLQNLPDEYTNSLGKTEDGRFLDTWRVAFFKPKVPEEKLDDLPYVFEKWFKNAPSGLSAHMETWFTQPLNSD